MNWPDDFVNKIICGDCLEVMNQIPDESVDMVMTSPPYWGLRDYGIEQMFGGNKDCEHEWGGKKESKKRFDKYESGKSRNDDRFFGDDPTRKFYAQHEKHESFIYCQKCQAWRGQLGLEPTPELYIEHLTIIFNEAKRVLKKEGTLWLNIGDTYGGSSCGRHDYREKGSISPTALFSNKDNPQQKIMPKCLLMIPERLAWSLIQNGWILRNKIIWFKPNSMPSSVKDRFSNRWEYIFLFSKSRKYYFDLDSVRESHLYPDHIQRRMRQDAKAEINPFKKGTMEARHRKGLNVPDQLPHGIHRKRHSGYFGADGEYLVNPNGKNPGDIIETPTETRTLGAILGTGKAVKVPGGKGWTGHPPGGEHRIKHDPRWCPPEGKNPGDFFEITTQPFPEAHFAVFPEKLCEKPIKAGCPEQVCKRCGKARERISKPKFTNHNGKTETSYNKKTTSAGRLALLRQKARESGREYVNERIYLGRTSCNCNAGFKGGIILDPFAGAGTVGVVAKKLGRQFILIDIKKEYCKMAEKRIAQVGYQMELRI